MKNLSFYLVELPLVMLVYLNRVYQMGCFYLPKIANLKIMCLKTDTPTCWLVSIYHSQNYYFFTAKPKSIYDKTNLFSVSDDHSRVKLRDLPIGHTDYINANYIDVSKTLILL